MVQIYLTLKRIWSGANDLFKQMSGRSKIPVFASPESASAFIRANYIYTGDPINGAGDFYTHPERLQYAMELGQRIGKEKAFSGLYIDCDDVAAWAYAALSKINGCRPILITLVDSKIVGSHVICVYEMNGKFGAIDTNGHRLLPDINESTLCDVWKTIYSKRGYDYIMAVKTDYPF